MGGGDGAAVSEEFAGGLAGDAHGVGEGALGEGVGVEELFGEDFRRWLRVCGLWSA